MICKFRSTSLSRLTQTVRLTQSYVSIRLTLKLSQIYAVSVQTAKCYLLMNGWNTTTTNIEEDGKGTSRLTTTLSRRRESAVRTISLRQLCNLTERIYRLRTSIIVYCFLITFRLLCKTNFSLTYVTMISRLQQRFLLSRWHRIRRCAL